MSSILAMLHFVAFFAIWSSFLWFQQATKGNGWAAQLNESSWGPYFVLGVLGAANVLLVLSGLQFLDGMSIFW